MGISATSCGTNHREFVAGFLILIQIDSGFVSIDAVRSYQIFLRICMNLVIIRIPILASKPTPKWLQNGPQRPSKIDLEAKTPISWNLHSLCSENAVFEGPSPQISDANPSTNRQKNAIGNYSHFWDLDLEVNKSSKNRDRKLLALLGPGFGGQQIVNKS